MKKDMDSATDGSGSSSPLGIALNVVSALKELGLVVIETEPTDAMVAAGVAAGRTMPGGGAEAVRAMFKAMLEVGGRPAELPR